MTFRGSGKSRGWCRGTPPRLSTVRQQLAIFGEVVYALDYLYFLISGGGRAGAGREGRACVGASWRGGRGGVPL